MALPKLSMFDTPAGTPYTVRGEELHFRPLGWLVLLQLKNLIQPLAQVLAVAIGGGSDQKRIRQESVERDASKPENISKFDTTEVREPTVVSVEVLAYRDKSRREAIEQLMSAVTSPNNQQAIAKVIMNSLRGVFPDKPTDTDIQEFLAAVEIDVLFELLCGVYEANKGAFGPLGQRLKRILPEGTQAAENANTGPVAPATAG